MDKKISFLFTVVLVSAALIFLYVEKLTHEEFFLHLAAIPLEVLLAVFIVDMIYILNFIQDVLLVKETHPGKLFIEEAAQRNVLMKKSRKVLEDGIKKFLDYAIELKEKRPEMFEDLLDDYVQCAELCLLERQPAPPDDEISRQ